MFLLRPVSLIFLSSTAVTYILDTTIITEESATLTFLQLPSQFAEAHLPWDAVNAIEIFAPQLTSIDPVAASKLAQDLAAFERSWYATNPRPPIFSEYGDALNSLLQSKSLLDPEFQSIFRDAVPFEPSSRVSELIALLSPYPVLSSRALAYISAAQTYEPGYLLAEGSILSKDLSLTGPPPSIVAMYSSYLAAATAGDTMSEPGTSGLSETTSSAAATDSATAGSTSTSTGGAAAATAAVLVSNAVVLGLGVLGVALL